MIEFISDIGKKRSRNEDSIFVDDSICLIVLADGMGGLPCGDVASALTTQAVSSYMQSALNIKNRTEFNWIDLLQEAAEKAHEAVVSTGSNDQSCKGMGSTLVAGIIVKNNIYTCNVGDSNCFLFRKQLIQVTEDHSLAGFLRNSGTSPLDIPKQARSTLLQSIGNKNGIFPSTYTGKLKKKDKLLFCTDGLTDMVSNSIISDVLSSSLSLKEMVRTLVAEANKAGGIDNITVAIYEH